MGEADAVAEKVELVENGDKEVGKTSTTEEMDEAVADEKVKQHDEVVAMDEDKVNDEKVEAQEMDVDNIEAKGSKDVEDNIEEDMPGGKNEVEESITNIENHEAVKEDGENEKADSGKVEEEPKEEAKEGAEDKTEEEADTVKGEEMEEEEEEEEEESKEEKGSKKRARSNGNSVKGDRNRKKVSEQKEKGPKTPTEANTKEPKTPVEEEENDIKTPTTLTNERPVRERKSVERLVAVIEKDYARDFYVEKGRGTALKDIPNVAYKLSRKKTDDTFKLLHTILFGRRGKAAQVKHNISRFSGFVWNADEEKQMSKIKEKLDKCVKEKLLEFCDVLDIPIIKTTTRKEDIITKLVEFLLEPHATTSELLADKDQGKKRKRPSKSASKSSTPSEGSAKSQKKAKIASKKGEETKSTLPGSDDESEHEKEEGINGISERSDEMLEHADDKGLESDEESHENKGKRKPGSAKSSVKKVSGKRKNQEKAVGSEEESGEDKGKKKQGSTKSSVKKGSKISKSEDKGSESEEESEEETGSQKQGSAKSSVKKASEKSKHKKVTVSKKTSPAPKNTPAKSLTSRTKSDSDASAKKSSSKKKVDSVKKSALQKESVSKESTGKMILKVKDKLREEAIKPSDEELNKVICEILKEVDFNTVTFTNILQLLGKRFNMDLMPRKSSIKSMIQDELTKLAEADDDEDDAGDFQKDETKPSSVIVKG